MIDMHPIHSFLNECAQFGSPGHERFEVITQDGQKSIKTYARSTGCCGLIDRLYKPEHRRIQNVEEVVFDFLHNNRKSFIDNPISNLSIKHLYALRGSQRFRNLLEEITTSQEQIELGGLIKEHKNELQKISHRLNHLQDLRFQREKELEDASTTSLWHLQKAEKEIEKMRKRFFEGVRVPIKFGNSPSALLDKIIQDTSNGVTILHCSDGKEVAINPIICRQYERNFLTALHEVHGTSEKPIHYPVDIPEDVAQVIVDLLYARPEIQANITTLLMALIFSESLSLREIQSQIENMLIALFQKEAFFVMTSMDFCVKQCLPLSVPVQQFLTSAFMCYIEPIFESSKNRPSFQKILLSFKSHYEMYPLDLVSLSTNIPLFVLSGFCYEHGIGVCQDENLSFKLYRQAAKQGHAPGQTKLAGCYEAGFGVQKNEETAFSYLKQAAAQGYAPAENMLGVFYNAGIGVDLDFAKAVQCFEKAANSGNVWGLRNLGECYYNGTGREKDLVKGCHYYKLAADRGLAEAQSLLGNCYFNGKGVPEDKLQALYYHQLASAQGYTPSQNWLKRLSHF